MQYQISRDRLLAKRNVTSTGCWEWTGERTAAGYGLVYVSRTPRKRAYVHRVAVEVFRNQTVEGVVVCHHCDNPPCFNPDHLFVGDQAANMRDALGKGRTRANAKLDNATAQIIRCRALAGERQRALAAEFGITPAHISYLVQHGQASGARGTEITSREARTRTLPRCVATTTRGGRCGRTTYPGRSFCWQHEEAM